jgi:hypothetical protein
MLCNIKIVYLNKLEHYSIAFNKLNATSNKKKMNAAKCIFFYTQNNIFPSAFQIISIRKGLQINIFILPMYATCPAH